MRAACLVLRFHFSGADSWACHHADGKYDEPSGAFGAEENNSQDGGVATTNTDVADTVTPVPFLWLSAEITAFGDRSTQGVQTKATCPSGEEQVQVSCEPRSLQGLCDIRDGAQEGQQPPGPGPIRYTPTAQTNRACMRPDGLLRFYSPLEQMADHRASGF
ncbi:hypothetical protein AAFF_G00413960 [Aldrovandia affinis]|uniref:Uncharacterized protein n=1 Tax=Aldrovandia affinis TaxID=143900 RepID=A0AAD7WJQ7_9TELE|nr:hypothetical protein AAFF_G00413960 [Aldrovandia affinis]